MGEFNRLRNYIQGFKASHISKQSELQKDVALEHEGQIFTVTGCVFGVLCYGCFGVGPYLRSKLPAWTRTEDSNS